MIDFDVELALKLLKIIREVFPNAPRDIGIILAQEVFLHDLEKAGKKGAEVGDKLRKQIVIK